MRRLADRRREPFRLRALPLPPPTPRRFRWRGHSPWQALAAPAVVFLRSLSKMLPRKAGPARPGARPAIAGARFPPRAAAPSARHRQPRSRAVRAGGLRSARLACLPAWRVQAWCAPRRRAA
ncbi:hypothetical protein ACU4GD_04095 [Cupriavidus basilensis]